MDDSLQSELRFAFYWYYLAVFSIHMESQRADIILSLAASYTRAPDLYLSQSCL